MVRASSDVSMFYGAQFRLHSMMTKWRFNSILAALKYMDVPFPSFKDVDDLSF